MVPVPRLGPGAAGPDEFCMVLFLLLSPSILTVSTQARVWGVGGAGAWFMCRGGDCGGWPPLDCIQTLTAAACISLLLPAGGIIAGGWPPDSGGLLPGDETPGFLAG